VSDHPPERRLLVRHADLGLRDRGSVRAEDAAVDRGRPLRRREGGGRRSRRGAREVGARVERSAQAARETGPGRALAPGRRAGRLGHRRTLHRGVAVLGDEGEAQPPQEQGDRTGAGDGEQRGETRRRAPAPPQQEDEAAQAARPLPAQPQPLAQAIEPALDLRPDRAPRPPEPPRDLVDLQPLRVAQVEDLAIGLGQRLEQALHLGELRGLVPGGGPVRLFRGDGTLAMEAVVLARSLAIRRVAREHAEPGEETFGFGRRPAQRAQECVLNGVVGAVGTDPGAHAAVDLAPQGFQAVIGQAGAKRFIFHDPSGASIDNRPGSPLAGRV